MAVLQQMFTVHKVDDIFFIGKDKDKKKKQISIGYLGQKEGKNYQSWCQISTTHMINAATNQT